MNKGSIDKSFSPPRRQNKWENKITGQATQNVLPRVMSGYFHLISSICDQSSACIPLLETAPISWKTHLCGWTPNTITIFGTKSPAFLSLSPLCPTQHWDMAFVALSERSAPNTPWKSHFPKQTTSSHLGLLPSNLNQSPWSVTQWFETWFQVCTQMIMLNNTHKALEGAVSVHSH